ncbi:MAG TPA: putative glycoside hydrolase [Clostridiaceae bacterium]|nr:putative glycoside hydrolase [Clostridiaceae bacterium]
MLKSTLKNIIVVVTVMALFMGFSSGCGKKKAKETALENEEISFADVPSETGDASGNNEANSPENSNDQNNLGGGNSSDPENNSSTNNGVMEQEARNQMPIGAPIKVKALYLTGWVVGNPSRVEHYINLAKTTEINSYVIDIKDDDGYVGYESQIPEVRELGAWKYKYDVDKVLKAFHDNDIYIIGRLVCFKDPVLSTKRPELAVKHVNGGLWRDNFDLTWLDPYNKDSWPYLIEIAREAVNRGFDEIQFDYVRFPNEGNKKAMKFMDTDQKKYEAINEFLAYAKKELPGVIISADVFGIICESPEDTEDIGQYLELIGKDIDYISPMVYPSHYALGQTVNNVVFPKPDLEPYGVVYNSLVKAVDRISKVTDYKAKIRPYIQDFTASWLRAGNYQKYGAEQVRQQIQAVYDAGLDEWIVWDAENTYSEDAFLKE